MAMEFLSGQTLTRRISETMVLGVRDTVKIARQIARGLTEAHANGIIHRDLKPSNVMLVVGRDGEDLAKIVDFGIVKLIGEDSRDGEELTREGSFIGSPKYMAPEQITRGGKIDERTDIYAFGIILYQCLTGTVPFEGDSSVQTLMAHLNQPVPLMSERVTGLEVPEWLEQLVMGCLEKDPEQRPQTMASVARALGEAEAVLNSGRKLTSHGDLKTSSPRGDSSSSSGGGSGRQISITTQGTMSSVVPAKSGRSVSGEDPTRTSAGIESRRTPKRSPLQYAMATLVFFTVGAGIVAALFPHARPETDPSGAQVETTIPPPPIIVPLTAAASKDDFTLTIDSIPSGAEVREGDHLLGTTPLLLTIGNESVRNSPRAFTVARDGFEPYALAQGASQTNVRLVAPLVGADAGTHTLVRRVPPPRGAPSSVSAPPPAPSGSPNLDIRLTR